MDVKPKSVVVRDTAKTPPGDTRTPVSFKDLRGWIAALDAAGELDRVKGRVDWNIELGTVTRLAQGPGTGKALLFDKIKDYDRPDSRCGRVFVSGLAKYSRVAMMMGLAPDTHPRELVKLGRTILNGAIPPRIVKTGACKDVIVKGQDVDLYDFPSPHWNRPDGGRYILTYGGVISKDPISNVMNVGIYRGMVASKTEIPMLMWRAQNIGHHVAAWIAAGHKHMPIAVAIGNEPTFGFCASAPITRGVCEYDVMGAIQGAPVDLVKCETVDLHVPASAEIVIEGMLTLDPADYVMEGPFAEFTGYIAGDKSPKPTIKVTAITHRKNPILHGAIEGALPGSYSENGICSSIMRAGVAWNILDRAGVPGVVDVWCPPVQMGINTVVSIKQSYRNQAKQVATRAVGLGRRQRALQACDSRRRRHRHPRLRGRRLGDGLPRERGRGRRADLPVDVRRRARSIHPQARSQRRAVRHRQVGAGADRRHHEPRLRSRPRFRRRAVPAAGVASRRRPRRRPRAVGGTGPDAAGPAGETLKPTSPIDRRNTP